MTEHPEWALPDPNDPANVQEFGEGTTEGMDEGPEYENPEGKGS